MTGTSDDGQRYVVYEADEHMEVPDRSWERDAARYPEPFLHHDLNLTAEQRALAAEMPMYRALLARHTAPAFAEDLIHANPQLTAHLPPTPIQAHRAATRYAVDDATIAAAAFASHRAALARHSDGPILGGDTA